MYDGWFFLENIYFTWFIDFKYVQVTTLYNNIMTITVWYYLGPMRKVIWLKYQIGSFVGSIDYFWTPSKISIILRLFQLLIHFRFLVKISAKRKCEQIPLKGYFQAFKLLENAWTVEKLLRGTCTCISWILEIKNEQKRLITGSLNPQSQIL